jgi:hypothetical protein
MLRTHRELKDVPESTRHKINFKLKVSAAFAQKGYHPVKTAHTKLIVIP